MSAHEIHAALIANPSPLREEIVRDVENFTVALFAISQEQGIDRLRLAGTGTLVEIDGRHYILTAAHVWEEVLRPAPVLGFTLREKVDHRYLIQRTDIIPFGPPSPEAWNEWGPDVALLRLPPEHVGAIQAYKVFYNVNRTRPSTPDTDAVETRTLMGTPADLGIFTEQHADIQINGLFMELEAREHVNNQFDYLDFNVDTTFPGIPRHFGGVSGGGLWRVVAYHSNETGRVESLKTLQGVAFYQIRVENNLLTVRCHGRRSIGAARRYIC